MTHDGCMEKSMSERDFTKMLQSATLKMKQLELRLVERYRDRKQEIPVSVIMPTWNRKYALKRAIDSVMAQKYQNFQLIVSDDGSTDGTGDFLRKEYGDTSKILYIYHEHRGVSHARNLALEQANGQIVAYLDSDNWWEKSYLLIMVNALADVPAQACAYCGIRVVNNINQSRFTRMNDYDRQALLNRNFIDMNIFVHQKSLYIKYGGFDCDLSVLEDWELILRYTWDNPPLVVQCCLANYYIQHNYNHLTLSHDAEPSYRKVRNMYLT